MPEERPRLIVSETVDKLPVLIIDKNGIIAGSLIEKLINHFNIVCVTGKNIEAGDNLVIVHFGKKIPVIPDVKYSLIMTVYSGEQAVSDMLPVLVKKASSLNANSAFITSLGFLDKKMKKILSKNTFDNMIKIIYGEIFGNEEFPPNQLTNYIHQIRTHQKIHIPGNGLQKTYPILYDDVVDGIISILFINLPKSKLVYLLPKHGFTQLAIARAFQKQDPMIKVDFTKQKFKETEYEIPGYSECFYTNYNLNEKLDKINLNKIPPPVLPETKTSSKPKKIRTPKIPKPPNKFLIFILFLLFFPLPLVFEFIFLIGGGALLVQSVKNLQENNIALAQRYNLFAKTGFVTSLFLSQYASGINPLLLIQKESIMQKAQTGLSFSEIDEDIINGVYLLKSIYSENSDDPKNDFLLFVAKTKSSLASLQKLNAEGDLPVEFTDKLNTFQKPLSILGSTIDTLPEILGFYQNKKYLILFQNNMELRPGGGFIGSYATVEIRNGKTGKFEIRDIYDADGKLSTHVEPPFALRRYLGVSHLFLRDSNFDVDFIDNASQAQKFLELETGEKVDGVIAIDIGFVKDLIKLFGPLHIDDFRETVTADNFYLLTQTNAEKDFFPGSTQKKDFLRGVFNALKMKLTVDQKIPYGKLAQIISNAFSEKHLLVAFPGTETQTIFSVNNLSGSIQDNRQPKENDFLDYLGINEANLGMNKTNYYLKRSIEQKVSITDNGDVKEKATIIYENRSSKDSPFGGDYKNYLRFILPEKAILDSVDVNGTTIPTAAAVTDLNLYTRKDFIPPQQLEVEKNQKYGKVIYGFLTIIPMGTSQNISITYSIPGSYSLAKAVLNYDLSVFKQPGTDNDAYTFSITYPKEYQAIQFPPEFSNVGGKYIYTGDLSEDKNISLKFSRK